MIQDPRQKILEWGATFPNFKVSLDEEGVVTFLHDTTFQDIGLPQVRERYLLKVFLNPGKGTFWLNHDYVRFSPGIPPKEIRFFKATPEGAVTYSALYQGPKGEKTVKFDGQELDVNLRELLENEGWKPEVSFWKRLFGKF